MRIMRRVILLTTLIGASFSLVGCDDRVGVDGGVCASLKQYSREQQRAAAVEIRKNPNGELAKLVRDYGLVRKACRI